MEQKEEELVSLFFRKIHEQHFENFKQAEHIRHPYQGSVYFSLMHLLYIFYTRDLRRPLTLFG